MPQGEHVAEITHAEPPGGPRAGPRQLIDGAEHVSRREVEQRLLGDARIFVDRDAHAVATGIHVREQPADVLAHQVRLQRPRRVGVADGEREVRHAAQHHALVGHRVGEVDSAAVDGQLDATQGEQLQAGGGHHDVGLELFAGFQPQAVLREGRDPAGDHRGPLVPDGAEQVAVRHQAQALVPGVVDRLEMRVDLVPGRQLLDRHAADPVSHHLRPALAELVDQRGDEHVLPPDEGVGPARPDQGAQARVDRILGGQADDVAGRALQHRHVPGGLGHGRHERHRGRAAADHDDPFTRVIQVLGPLLRVYHLAAEVPDARQRRLVPVVVAVVAAAQQQEAARQYHGFGAVGGLHRPSRVGGGPGRPGHPVVVADVLVDPRLGGRVADVAEDRGAVRDGLGPGPRAERVTERLHVRVRAHARVAEEVPGAAHDIAGLEDDVGPAGERGLQVVRSADPGQPGPDDQHVDVLAHWRTAPRRGRSRFSACAMMAK